MANQIIVTANNTVQVAIEPTPQVQVQISRAAIGNVSANVANYANFAGNAFSVSLSNVVGAGNIASINLDGNVSNVLRGNGSFGPETASGNANYANFAGTAFSVSGSNVSGTVANATYAANAGYADNAGNSNFANTANIANTSNIANTAYSVSVGNVSGIGNIATINLDGNTSNVLKGDGTFGPEGTTGNANYANFAGTAYSVSGSNVSGAVANANYADNAGNANIANTAYSVSGANVSGAVANATYANDAGNANIANTAYSVAVGNVSGIGNIATINIDGNASNVLHGDGTFGPEGTTGNANYAAYAGNVTINAQPNITSVGTLDGLTVNATSAVNITSNGAANITATGGPITMYTNDTGNLNNIGPSLSYANPITGNTSTLSAGAGGAAVFIANSAVGNSFPGNVKSLWQFDTSGNLVHQFGGIGNLNAKGATINGTITAGNIYANSGTVGANLLTGTLTTAAQPNITTVGTLTGLNVSTSNSITVTTTNANMSLTVVDTANLGTALNITHSNVGAQNLSSLGTTQNGFTFFIGNTAGGNSFPGNVKAFWQFDSSGNLVHQLGGTGNINAKGANIAGNVTANGLVVNSTSNVNINSANSSINLIATETSNLSTRTGMQHYANWANNQSLIYALSGGVGVYISNTAAGNTGFGNVKSIWQFQTNGNLDHVFGGTGNINAKGLTLGSGSVTAGNVYANSGTIQGLNVYANSGTIQGLNVVASSNVQGTNINGTNVNATNGITGGNLTLNVNSSSQPIFVNQEGSGGASFYGMYTDNSVFPVQFFYRSRGNNAVRTAVQTNDTIFTQNYSVYADSGNSFVTPGYQENKVGTNYGNGVVSIVSTFAATTPAGSGSTFQVTGYDTTNLNGYVQVNSGNIILDGDNRRITVNGQGLGSSNTSQINVNNGTVNVNMNNVPAGIPSFAFATYENTNSFINPYTFYRARGNQSSPNNVQGGDVVGTQQFYCYGDSGNTYVSLGTITGSVKTNDNAGNVSASINLSTQNTNDGSEIVLNTDDIKLQGNVSTPYQLDYLRTFGSFTSNATQTSNGANTTNYMTLNNTEDANGVSIVSSSQITVARTGRYNIQFSTVLTHDTNQTANVEIWLTKNGSAVANTNTRLTIAKDQATAAAWNFVDNASTANTYYQLAWASPDTNVELLAVDTANTISGVAIPSVIVTVTPVGA